jgi:hypothetical protein
MAYSKGTIQRAEWHLMILGQGPSKLADTQLGSLKLGGREEEIVPPSS